MVIKKIILVNLHSIIIVSINIIINIIILVIIIITIYRKSVQSLPATTASVGVQTF